MDVNIDDEWNDGLWQATRPDWEEGVGSRITGNPLLKSSQSAPLKSNYKTFFYMSAINLLMVISGRILN